ncbi:MAG: transketolase [Solirubrobacteraceae bacterium]|jgi:transketolase|nr:transketolase [Solirubrobacteraceae bacterium]
MSPTTIETHLDELCVNTIRTLSMDAVQKANSGHPGTPMALAPIGYSLYTRIMRHNPADAAWFDRDRFVLSCGHASMLLYSVLYLTGYGLELEDLQNFRQLGSPCAGHPEYGHAPGIEATTGPLGAGISNCVGLALAERMLAARFNRPDHEIVNHRTFTICSDGDLQEGISAESCSLAGHLGLGRLVAYYDDNHISIEGDTSLSFSEDVGARFEAYGWHVENLGEDLSLERIDQATDRALAVTDKPSLIICRTHIAPGSPNKEDTEAAHGSPLGEEEVRLTKEVYGWPAEPTFHVPPEALDHTRGAIARGIELQADWDSRFAAYREEHPELADELSQIVERRAPALPDGPLVEFAAGKLLATRQASQQCIQAAAAIYPTLVGGSADLAPSNLTHIEGAGDVEKGAYGGRNLHFGIREHGMGAIVNGLVLGGLKAFGATFLIFSDYMKGAIRLAALMELPSIFVFTHDSIGVGEDGPTHQPVEQLASLRATPNIDVVRPADANETALAWRFALGQTVTPTALILSRQGLPTIDAKLIPDDAIERGAYVLRDVPHPEAILMASGSEVATCVEAAVLLEDQGISVRVVSMPCLDRFAAASQAYRNAILPPDCRVRVAVEAASPLGWDRWTGDIGAIIGMPGFGASAPGDEVFAHFGFTAEAIAARARELLGAADG